MLLNCSRLGCKFLYLSLPLPLVMVVLCGTSSIISCLFMCLSKSTLSIQGTASGLDDYFTMNSISHPIVICQCAAVNASLETYTFWWAVLNTIRIKMSFIKSVFLIFTSQRVHNYSHLSVSILFALIFFRCGINVLHRGGMSLIWRKFPLKPIFLMCIREIIVCSSLRFFQHSIIALGKW